MTYEAIGLRLESTQEVVIGIGNCSKGSAGQERGDGDELHIENRGVGNGGGRQMRLLV